MQAEAPAARLWGSLPLVAHVGVAGELTLSHIEREMWGTQPQVKF
jgi:hypothetical protein